MPSPQAQALAAVTLETKALQREIGRLISRFPKRAEMVVKKVAMDATRDILKATPVDTGRARGSWMPYLMSRDARYTHGGTSLIRGPNVSPDETRKGIAEGEFDARGGSSPRVRVTSTVAYMPELEAGKSRQAPTGMVAVTLAKHREHFARELKDGFDETVRRGR